MIDRLLGILWKQQQVRQLGVQKLHLDVGVVVGVLSSFYIWSSVYLTTCFRHKRSNVSQSMLKSSVHCRGFSFSNVVFSFISDCLQILHHICSQVQQMKAQAKEEKLRRQIGMFKLYAQIFNVSFCSSYYEKHFCLRFMS